MTDPDLREFIDQRFVALELRLDERRESDQAAVVVARTAADAALDAHNQLIKQMREQAVESQRQLDKLTDTYATKENLRTLETLIDQRLVSIDGRLQSIDAASGAVGAAKKATRVVWSDLRGVVLVGFAFVGCLLAIATYIAQH